MNWIKKLYLEYQIRTLKAKIDHNCRLLNTCNKYDAIPLWEENGYLTKALQAKQLELTTLS